MYALLVLVVCKQKTLSVMFDAAAVRVRTFN